MKFEKVGRVSSASDEKCTGKSWDEWIPLLIKAGAAAWPHPEIVLYIRKKYKLGPWWEQIVASCFEIAVANKIEGRNEKGLYAVGASRILPMSKPKLWKLLTSDVGVGIWLKPFSQLTVKPGEKFENEGMERGGAFGEIRTMEKGVRIRLRWQESDSEKPMVVQVYLHARPGEKCDLGFQLDSVPNARLKEVARTYWRAILDELSAHLERPAKLKKKPEPKIIRRPKS